MSPSKTDAIMRQAGWWTIAEIAERTGKHRQTVYEWTWQHKLDVRKVGVSTYVSLDSLVRFLGEDNARLFGFITAADEPRKGA